MQWMNAWIPKIDRYNEVAFIFEDDIEVSRFYYKWAKKALERYYQSKEFCQLFYHKRLLEAVRKEIEKNHQTNARDQDDSNIREYSMEAAGLPVLYGICLQSQHLDPSHHPKKLNIRNGYRSFLFR